VSISDARAARASQSLDKPIRLLTGEIVTRREHMRRLHAGGAALKTWRKHLPKAEETLRAEVERLERGWSVPIGNPNHPDTKAYQAKKDALASGVYKDVTIVETPSGTFHEVSKAEADYFISLGANEVKS
jgi:hypothetical protein